MTRARWVAAAAVGAALGGAGCVSCETRTARANWETAPAAEVSTADRRHVYAILVNGACPAGCASLEALRDSLADRGYAKAYFGQTAHVPWLAREMRAVAACDPGARFVVVGCDVSAPLAAHLARAAMADGLAVDAVVLLDPLLMSPTDGCPTRTVLVTSSHGCAVPHTERKVVTGATRLSLPGHPGTVDVVCDLLKESAARVEYPPAVFDAPPTDGRLNRDVTPPANLPAEWLYLFDHPQYPTPLTPPPAAGPIAPALIPRGGYAPPPDLPRPQPVLPQWIPWQSWPTNPATPLPVPRKMGETP